MTWVRAAVVAIALVAIAFGALVYVPDLLLTSLTGVARSTRVFVATVWFTAAVAGKYVLVCNIEKHYTQGMRSAFTVTS